jgi:Lipase (class 3)
LASAFTGRLEETFSETGTTSINAAMAGNCCIQSGISLRRKSKMTGDAQLLERNGFDLDTAVVLADASAAAYSEAGANDFASRMGFARVTPFDSENIQGYWCESSNVALLVFRGTNNIGQWLRDLRVLPAAHEWGWVHLGFARGISAVENDLRGFDEVAASPGKHVWVSGHSLGGALAVLAAARLKIKKICAPLLHTYGQPAVGLPDFAQRFDAELPNRLWHVINQSDVVPRVPPLFRHCGVSKHIVRPGTLEALEGLAPTTQHGRALVARDYAQEETLRDIILGGARQAGLEAPQPGPELNESEPVPLNEFELGRLQVALGAGEPPGMEGVTLEGAIPFLNDHRISEYIRLLKDIRDTPQA